MKKTFSLKKCVFSGLLAVTMAATAMVLPVSDSMGGTRK